jgi:putative membrane protein
VDANNLQPEFREEILGDLKKFKFDFVDVFTTDSHSVNAVGGIHNRLGERCDKREVTKEIVSTVEAALGNLEPCVASFQTFRFKAKVLGVKRTSELITTFNSIVAVLRIIAPAVMLGAVGAALFLLTKIK